MLQGHASLWQGWAEGSFVEAEARQGRNVRNRGKAEAEADPLRPRRGDPLKNLLSPRCIAVPNLVASSQTV